MLAELAGPGNDPGGQVLHARFVLQWLADELYGLPLWNGGPGSPHVTDGAPYARSRAEIEETYDWALLARLRYLWPGESAADVEWQRFGWGFGAMQLLAWVCGDAGEGPLSGKQVAGRPSLYQVSLDCQRAMTALLHARQVGHLTAQGRLEAIMDAFLWLAGWSPLPPVDKDGHGSFESSPAEETGARSPG